MNLLYKKYSDILNKEIDTFDITFLLRDAFCYYNRQKTSKKDLHQIKSEVLCLIKNNKEKLNWHKKDIDNCIPLTYSLFNQVNDISDYLLNNIYDTSIYSKELSQAIGASVHLDNLSYFKKLIKTWSMHFKIKENLIIHSIKLAVDNETGLKPYYDFLITIDSFKHVSFIYPIVENLTINKLQKDFKFFLYHNPYEPEAIISTTEQYFNNKEGLDDFKEIFFKWRLYYDLRHNLDLKNYTKINKV